jgi:BolA protein
MPLKGPDLMPVRDAIVAKLSAKFAPSHLEVVDESNRHQGHAGSRPEGETHFRVRITSAQLTGSRVAQHRAIMETLDAEIKGGVHALAIEVIAAGSPQAGPSGN